MYPPSRTLKFYKIAVPVLACALCLGVASGARCAAAEAPAEARVPAAAASTEDVVESGPAEASKSEPASEMKKPVNESASPEKADSAGEADKGAEDVKDNAGMEERYGVRVESVRISAAGYMVDFRYTVLDKDKAAPVFLRANKPYLYHQKSGKSLQVSSSAKVGPLRNSNTPIEGRTYFIFFNNLGRLVNPGDKVDIKIGDYHVKDFVVQ